MKKPSRVSKRRVAPTTPGNTVPIKHSTWKCTNPIKYARILPLLVALGITFMVYHVQSIPSLSPKPEAKSADVALILVGRSASIIKRGVRKFIRQNLINTLSTNQSIHTFLFTDTLITNNLTMIQQDLGPSLIHIQLKENFCPDPLSSRSYCCDICKEKPELTPAGCLQFDAIQYGMEFASNYAKQHGFEYKWFVRSRPDFVPFEPIGPVDNYDPETVHLTRKEQGWYTDFFWVVSNKLQQWFHNQSMEFFKQCSMEGPEDILWGNMRKKFGKDCGKGLVCNDHAATLVRLQPNARIPDALVNNVECFRMRTKVPSKINPATNIYDECVRLASSGAFE